MELNGFEIEKNKVENIDIVDQQRLYKPHEEKEYYQYKIYDESNIDIDIDSFKSFNLNKEINGEKFFLTYGCCKEHNITKEKLLAQLIENFKNHKPKRKIIKYVISQENYKKSKSLVKAQEFHIHVYIQLNKELIIELKNIGKLFDYKTDLYHRFEGNYQVVLLPKNVIIYILKEDPNPLTNINPKKIKKLRDSLDYKKIEKTANQDKDLLRFRDFEMLELIKYSTILFTEKIETHILHSFFCFLKKHKIEHYLFTNDIHSELSFRDLHIIKNNNENHSQESQQEKFDIIIIYEPTYSNAFRQKDLLHTIKRRTISDSNTLINCMFILNENSEFYNSPEFIEIKKLIENQKKENIQNTFFCDNIKNLLRMKNENDEINEKITNINIHIGNNNINNITNNFESNKIQINELTKEINYLKDQVKEMNTVINQMKFYFDSNLEV